jgi:hypothetical protein
MYHVDYRQSRYEAQQSVQTVASKNQVSGHNPPVASTFVSNWQTAMHETRTVGYIPNASSGSRRLRLVRRLHRLNQKETGNQGSTAARP